MNKAGTESLQEAMHLEVWKGRWWRQTAHAHRRTSWAGPTLPVRHLSAGLLQSKRPRRPLQGAKGTPGTADRRRNDKSQNKCQYGLHLPSTRTLFGHLLFPVYPEYFK